ncbi:hypothetical protein CEP52_012992 [Fusarium oligoseptatum]|uniref:Uncharacterized protein n=1 Tax=Fusarium oligoseptatum TaxID=2604345 RepID=A0A428SVR2_9HYPO|nr:hypothetical protein CEP52_012992 [Fusarium oligoseptatum]
MAQMPMLIRQNRVPEMAWLLLQACPGDWDCGWGPLVRSTLTRAIKRELSEKELAEAAVTIRFRWELALYADHLVKTFGLQVPGGEVCILWDFGKWLEVASSSPCSAQEHVVILERVGDKGAIDDLRASYKDDTAERDAIGSKARDLALTAIWEDRSVLFPLLAYSPDLCHVPVLLLLLGLGD